MSINYCIAKDKHAKGIQQLISSPLGDKWSIRTHCEPSLHDALACEGHRQHSVIAHDKSTILGHGARIVRRVLYQGKIVNLGYLSYLRKASTLNGINGVQTIQKCMKLLRKQRGNDECTFDLTSIMSDNLSAIDFLTRNGINMPHYKQCSTYHSFIIASQPMRIKKNSEHISIDCLCDFVNAAHKDYLLAPHCSPEGFQIPSLAQSTRVHCTDEHQRLTACAILWDQRSVKQHSIAQIPVGIKVLRPLINTVRHCRSLPHIPKLNT
ncbi:MAG: hypothetical protein HRU15_10875, partial [Planctomycetes bacterium]|nr:hypothetical protein [Planctomycetota bacterium]